MVGLTPPTSDFDVGRVDEVRKGGGVEWKNRSENQNFELVRFDELRKGSGVEWKNLNENQILRGPMRANKKCLLVFLEAPRSWRADPWSSNSAAASEWRLMEKPKRESTFWCVRPRRLMEKPKRESIF